MKRMIKNDDIIDNNKITLMFMDLEGIERTTMDK